MSKTIAKTSPNLAIQLHNNVPIRVYHVYTLKEFPCSYEEPKKGGG